LAYSAPIQGRRFPLPLGKLGRGLGLLGTQHGRPKRGAGPSRGRKGARPLRLRKVSLRGEGTNRKVKTPGGHRALGRIFFFSPRPRRRNPKPFGRSATTRVPGTLPDGPRGASSLHRGKGGGAEGGPGGLKRAVGNPLGAVGPLRHVRVPKGGGSEKQTKRNRRVVRTRPTAGVVGLKRTLGEGRAGNPSEPRGIEIGGVTGGPPARRGGAAGPPPVGGSSPSGEPHARETGRPKPRRHWLTGQRDDQGRPRWALSLARWSHGTDHRRG